MKRLLTLVLTLGISVCVAAPALAAWSTPVLFPHNTKTVDRMPSVAGYTLYYIKDYDIWQSTWDGNTWSEPIVTPGKVNSSQMEINPMVVRNGTVMYFLRMNGGTSYDYFRSEWDAAIKEWAEPTLVSELSSPMQDWDIWVNEEETQAYITSPFQYGQDVPGGRNIFMSERSADGTWSMPISIGSVVNSDKDEMDVAVDKDGRIYFASNREGSMGDFDIFMAESAAGPVSNVTSVNAPKTDKTPFVSGKWLVFESSGREGNVGGYDVWISTWE